MTERKENDGKEMARVLFRGLALFCLMIITLPVVFDCFWVELRICAVYRAIPNAGVKEVHGLYKEMMMMMFKPVDMWSELSDAVGCYSLFESCTLKPSKPIVTLSDPMLSWSARYLCSLPLLILSFHKPSRRSVEPPPFACLQ